NYYTALTFLVTFFVKKKSNKLLMGGEYLNNTTCHLTVAFVVSCLLNRSIKSYHLSVSTTKIKEPISVA
ncbi:MAG: hypothetical protein KA783_09720, partial [Chitinophagales bacterium]|nr:hypothetical protein [Chitinophagales bacterium]